MQYIFCHSMQEVRKNAEQTVKAASVQPGFALSVLQVLWLNPAGLPCNAVRQKLPSLMAQAIGTCLDLHWVMWAIKQRRCLHRLWLWMLRLRYDRLRL